MNRQQQRRAKKLIATAQAATSLVHRVPWLRLYSHRAYTNTKIRLDKTMLNLSHKNWGGEEIAV